MTSNNEEENKSDIILKAKKTIETIINEIELLKNYRPNNNISCFILIASLIDTLSFLAYGTDPDKRKKPGKTKKEYIGFIESYFPKGYKQYANKIYQDFRCKLLHISGTSGGIQLISGKERYNLTSYTEENCTYTLINFENFLTSIKEAKDKLFELAYKNDEIKNNIINNYKYMIKIYTINEKKIFPNSSRDSKLNITATSGPSLAIKFPL